MSRTWSPRSKRVYDTLDERLQRLVTRIRDEVADVSLTSGYRDRVEQNGLFENNLSTLRYPDSKHNRSPSLAVDLQPYPYPRRDVKLWGALGYIAGRAYEIAYQEGFRIRWGGDWNGNGDMTDQNFDDLFHLEIQE
jgi:peptidoglycan L-alanyl-D-glutamate endopeptidase CwlK